MVAVKNLTYRLLLSVCKLNFLKLLHVLGKLKMCVRECIVTIKSSTAICKIYDFECVMYVRTQFVLA